MSTQEFVDAFLQRGRVDTLQIDIIYHGGRCSEVKSEIHGLWFSSYKDTALKYAKQGWVNILKKNEVYGYLSSIIFEDVLNLIVVPESLAGPKAAEDFFNSDPGLFHSFLRHDLNTFLLEKNLNVQGFISECYRDNLLELFVFKPCETFKNKNIHRDKICD